MKNRVVDIDKDTIALIINHKGSEYLSYVDKSDLHKISAIKGTWCLAVNRTGHIDGVKTKIQKSLSRKQIWLHNIVLQKEKENNVIDHIDHNTLNNKKSNLREVTRRENAQNVSTTLSSTTKHRNVTIENGYYRVRINGISLGRYKTIEKAISVADTERIKIFPKSSLLNKKIKLHTTMKELRKKTFKNGVVYCLQLEDGFLVETTDTFLPYYTKDAIGRHQNKLDNNDLGDRTERWMIGVSTMSGCPVRCKFCATGNMKRYRNLTAAEIVAQVDYAISHANGADPAKAKEFKINYTRMGEPFLNIEAVKEAIRIITERYPNTHHYVSTIGIKDSDFSFIKDNITLQISLHSFDDDKRNWLIPYKNKMSIKELGQIRTQSNLKTTINLTLVDTSDFDAGKLQEWFDKEHFFVKLSPINPNNISEKNHLGNGVVEGVNLV